MGMRFLEGATCTGILLPVSDDELLKFDEREAGYDRLAIPPWFIEKVPFLEQGRYEKEWDKMGILNNLIQGPNVQTEDDPETGSHNSGKIWIYRPKVFCPPTLEKPIAQTYVDTVLRGCLSISEEFAKDFITSTRGWSTDDLGENKINNFEGDKGEVFWVNDRQDPIYLRADNDYILKNACKIDLLLQKFRANEFLYRTTWQQQVEPK